MKIDMLTFDNKRIRSKIIKKHMQDSGYDKAVCFSCGNASNALKQMGVNTLDISPTGDLLANRWFTPGEVNKTFDGYFDATPGHLPAYLMLDIANEIREELNLNEKLYYVPTGSGETIICLSLAFPHIEFVAVYNFSDGSAYDEQAPLNEWVERKFKILDAKDFM